MHFDSEWMLFLYAYLASALTALSPILLTTNKPITFRLVLGTIIFYGGLGSGFGMTIGYEYLGGRQHPLRVIVYSILVGAGTLKKKDITAAFRTVLTGTLKNILGALDGSTSTKSNNHTKPGDTDSESHPNDKPN